MTKSAIIFTLFLIVLFQLNAQNTIHIIPEPEKILISKGSFALTEKTSIGYIGDNQAKSVTKQLITRLNRSSGFKYEIATKTNSKSSIVFIVDKKKRVNDEAYDLIIKPNQIKISASSAHGLFNGLQTLRQLFPAAIESPNTAKTTWTIPCVQIEDAPRYAYRGLLLDVSRHFFDKEFVKKYIDMMAMYKYNTFHWHLTDDQGWRIEIKKYPLLTTKSAFRKECDGQTTGGFYTQDDIKEVVAYAAERFITVVPEVDMPGHAVAVLASYPELSCSGGPFKVETTWGIFHDVFCAGNDKTYEFLENVLDEVAPLFPGKYFHIGGDECKKTRWERCIKCQNKIKTEGLADEHELQSYFIKRMEKYLQAKGKQIIGWDEILEGGVSKTATIMSWRGTKGGIQAAKQGNDVIMTPSTHCYLNYYQGVESEEPLALKNNQFLPLQKVYTFDPTPEGFTAEQARFILGGQGNVWAEYISTPAEAEYMVYPRALALSECLWSQPKNKNYSSFEQKIHAHYDRMVRYGINFSKSADRQSTIDKWRVALNNK